MPDADNALMPVTDIAATYEVAITAEGLEGGRCSKCGEGSCPRAYICCRCNSTKIDAVKHTGSGSLYSWTTVRISPTFPTPYTVGYVDLDGGLRVLGQILTPTNALQCDLPVEAIRDHSSPTGWGFRAIRGVTQ